MLSINWADVEGVLKTIASYLIGFGIIAVIAIIAMIACMKLAKHTKFLIRAEAGLAVFLALAITVNLICFGPMSSMIDLATGGGTIEEATSAEAMDVAVDIAREGMVLLKNDGGLLPLANGSGLNLYGSTYRNPSYTNNTSAADFAQGQHYLELSQPEREMVEMVCSNFDNVIVIYNGAGTLELGFTQEFPQIKSVLWCPAPGQVGFTALGEIMNGTVNPSGKTADIFVRDLTATPVWNNSLPTNYDNMDEFNVPGLLTDTPATPNFLHYVEGIYVGYKFYETAAAEGLIDYDSTVLYPFGHGLSYTTFTQEMGPVSENNGTISFDVTVTNTGSVAGKDVVEVYYNPPYTNGGIEKASANLAAFDKTDLIQPGDSQTYTVAAEVDYSTGRSTDLAAPSNQFGFAAGDVTYLSRADGFANYAQATAAPDSLTLAPEYKAAFLNNSNYDPAAHNDPNDVMPITGAKNGLELAQLRGADYDDPRWETLLDQVTVSQMNELIAMGGYQTVAIDSIGKVRTNDCDGPAAINNNFTRVGSVGFPCAIVIACTWNEDMAHAFGDSIGKMANEMNVSGWYAPAMNIHRNALSGRNFEYYSEDGFLSGKMAAAFIGLEFLTIKGFKKRQG